MIFFFTWTEIEDELEGFLQRLNAFHYNLSFIQKRSKASINFLDVTVSINGEEIETDLCFKPTDWHQFLEFNSAHPIQKDRLCIAKGCALKGWVPKRIYLKNTLKIYVLGLTWAFISRNLLTIKLGGFLKGNQSGYLNIAQRLGLVYQLLWRIIFDFITSVIESENSLFTYMLKSNFKSV